MTEMSGRNWNVDTDFFSRTTGNIFTIFKERFPVFEMLWKDRDGKIT